MCSIGRTPAQAILAIATAFMVDGMKPAIDKKGTLLYQYEGGGCAAYLIASDDMKKIMSTTTHDKHNVCELRTDLDVRLHEMITHRKWDDVQKESFVQGLQGAHDTAAITYKNLLDSNMSEPEAKKTFNFVLKANLERLAKAFKVELEWPSSFDAIFKSNDLISHKKNDGRPPSAKAHKKPSSAKALVKRK